jgi:hypothetical protein
MLPGTGSRPIRTIPWLLAIAGLVIALFGSGFAGWWIALAWFAVLGVAWAVGGALVWTPLARIVVTIVMLPILLVPLAWYGGWWLIPADLAWLALELTDRTRSVSSRPTPTRGAVG